MMRSMFSGVSGLRTHQIRMDVVGNNIANVNTTAFKASRVTFQDIYSQTLKPAAGANNGLGGVNPLQVGLGTSLASIDVLHDRGSTERTDRPLDLAIAGEGFFVVYDGTQNYYTRAGNFSLDADGNLVDANGYMVRGVNWDPADPTTQPAPNGAASLESIQITNFTNYSDLNINKYGIIQAIDTATGDTVELGQIAVAVVPNTQGLLQEGKALYSESKNSGIPVIGGAGNNSAGFIDAGALEMSNVDLSKEFTDMIITQRGFQANSRIITTSDEMLQELLNLKR